MEISSSSSFWEQEIDDQTLALQLQLQEIEAQREFHTGKWLPTSPPDAVLAIDDFEMQVRGAMAVVGDARMAWSMERAVEGDAAMIEEVEREEEECARDREVARGLLGGGIADGDGGGSGSVVIGGGGGVVCAPEQEAAILLDLGAAEKKKKKKKDKKKKDKKNEQEEDAMDWEHVHCATEGPNLKTGIDSNTGTIAGPSTTYASGHHFPANQPPEGQVECVVCSESDSIHPDKMIHLACGDTFCAPCLKIFFLRVTKDSSLFPPKCHREPIPFSLVASDFTPEELATYRSAEEEFSCTDRFYCANAACAKFIGVTHRGPDQATCSTCGMGTCVHCKAAAHEGVCVEDEKSQAVIKFAEEQGWKTCFKCGEMIVRDEGCDHMTCRCKAEFCYRCGVQWKTCPCGDWVPELLTRRAEQVIAREAPVLFAPAVHLQRVVAMERELQRNHECTHSGRFTKLLGSGSRNGFVCEMCGARHRKYILSCKRCHVLACEDCRRHRV